MCRWLAFIGEPILLERLVKEPSNSLIEQSQHALKAKTAINGDGFGLGWYGEREKPGVYREILPAWADQNLASLCEQVRSSLFFAHVRASTGSCTSRANCHPFTADQWLFMHNGQIAGFEKIRRQIEALIPDDKYYLRQGTTDSEALFLALLQPDLSGNIKDHVENLIRSVNQIRKENNIKEAFRFTSTLSDGESLYAFRYASDNRAPTLFYREREEGITIASEPLDLSQKNWSEIPLSHGVKISKNHEFEQFALNGV